MAIYSFRCPTHGDFLVEQPMAETTRTTFCPECGGGECPKVLSGNIHYTYSKEVFHGDTDRETRNKMIQDNAAQGRVLGRDYESASRWV